MSGGQKPLVKIQRAELVKFKRAPTRGLCVDDSKSTTGLTLLILGKDMIIGNVKPAQHPKIGVSGEHFCGFRAVH